MSEPGLADERGELTIAPQVVEKIAAACAGEVDSVGGAARRVLDVALGSDDNAGRPLVDAVVDGRGVTLAVRCSVSYPAPVTQVTDRIRTRLQGRVTELTGLQVRQVDIDVVALTSPASRSGSGRREVL